jgi:hypothetical protein
VHNWSICVQSGCKLCFKIVNVDSRILGVPEVCTAEVLVMK